MLQNGIIFATSAVNALIDISLILKEIQNAYERN